MTLEQTAFLIGRLLFGGYFAFSGLNHFMQTDQMSGWVESKGVPQAKLMVYLTGVMLLAGGLSVMAGAYPVLGIGLIGLFLLVTSPVMHSFWEFEGEQRQSEMVNFLKNAALLGAALTMLSADWTVYAVGMTLGLL